MTKTSFPRKILERLSWRREIYLEKRILFKEKHADNIPQTCDFSREGKPRSISWLIARER